MPTRDARRAMLVASNRALARRPTDTSLCSASNAKSLWLVQGEMMPKPFRHQDQPHLHGATRMSRHEGADAVAIAVNAARSRAAHSARSAGCRASARSRCRHAPNPTRSGPRHARGSCGPGGASPPALAGPEMISDFNPLPAPRPVFPGSRGAVAFSGPPRDGCARCRRRATFSCCGATQLGRRLPRSLQPEQLTWMPSGREG